MSWMLILLIIILLAMVGGVMLFLIGGVYFCGRLDHMQSMIKELSNTTKQKEESK